MREFDPADAEAQTPAWDDDETLARAPPAALREQRGMAMDLARLAQAQAVPGDAELGPAKGAPAPGAALNRNARCG